MFEGLLIPPQHRNILWHSTQPDLQDLRQGLGAVMEADGAHFAVAPCHRAFDDAQIPSAGQVEDLRVKGETVHSLSCEEISAA